MTIGGASALTIAQSLLPRYAEAQTIFFTDERINAMRPDYESALKAKHVHYQAHTYEGTSHGFHNNSMPRYDEAAAKLAWDRTIAFFKQHLA